MRWFEIIVGVITALSAAAALWFAKQTVKEAREASKEARGDRAARRIETMTEVVSKIRLANQGSNRVLSGMYQEQLRPLVAALADDLPRTHELSERKFSGPGHAEDNLLAERALIELREAARSKQ
jgi:hypothetical protein